MQDAEYYGYNGRKNKRFLRFFMREGLLDILRCPVCRRTSLHIEGIGKDKVEIRKGKLLCDSCNSSYEIEDGIVDFIKNPNQDIKREQDVVATEEYLWDEKGNRYRIGKDSIERFRKQFLLLPEGDGSVYFKRAGCFQSIAEGSHRFYNTLEQMALKGDERVLCLGDGFGYASYKFAQLGCSVVALDISNYLLASDIYIKNAYFERVFSDMHEMPFKDNIFDVMFCSAALHHSRNLKTAFQEIRRTLKEGGKLFIINESSRGIFERLNPLFEDLNKRGYSDTCYTIPKWIGAACSAGFSDLKVEFLSLADDYIVRQRSKGRQLTSALRFTYFLQRHRYIERALLFLLKFPRILFRPKSWRMVCVK
jgi:ubiquinone/menaquinone biosynthesis C-methylase UbiE/uncharacterized protein YbaR (Trm112 family)